MPAPWETLALPACSVGAVVGVGCTGLELSGPHCGDLAGAHLQHSPGDSASLPCQCCGDAFQSAIHISCEVCPVPGSGRQPAGKRGLLLPVRTSLVVETSFICGALTAVSPCCPPCLNMRYLSVREERILSGLSWHMCRHWPLWPPLPYERPSTFPCLLDLTWFFLCLLTHCTRSFPGSPLCQALRTAV